MPNTRGKEQEAVDDESEDKTMDRITEMFRQIEEDRKAEREMMRQRAIEEEERRRIQDEQREDKFLNILKSFRDIHQQSSEEKERMEQERKIAEERDRQMWIEQTERDRRALIEALTTGKEENPSARSASSFTNELKLLKLTDEDDIEHFLTTFERVAASCEWKKETWAIRLAPLLTGKARAAFVSMDVTETNSYDAMKRAILIRYDINDETYRQRFRSSRKKQEETYTEFGIQMKDLFKKWVHLDKVTVNEICDVMVIEQLIDKMPLELQVWLREKKPTTLEEASSLADSYVMARKPTKSNDKQCYLCKQMGHVAAQCKSKPLSVNKPPEQKRDTNETERKSRRDIRCYKCGLYGHIALRCPGVKRPSAFFADGNDEFREDSINNRDCGAKRTPDMCEMYCTGYVDGKRVDMLVDTGAARTIVHRTLVPQERINYADKIAVKCAHGDVVEYPTCEVTLTIHDKEYTVKAGVSPNLPRLVLLGRDVENLMGLLRREEETFLVETRAQRLKAEREEAVRLVKDIKGAVPNSDFLESDELDNVYPFDKELFSKTGKQRKSRKQKRCDKQNYNIKLASGSGESEETNSSRRTLNDIGITRTRLVELLKFDPTLEMTRLYVKGDKTPREGITFFERDGLMYRKWQTRNHVGEDIEQLVLSTECRRSVLEIAHDIPLSGHLGRQKTLNRVLQRFYWPGIFNDVKDYCKACGVCQKVAPKQRHERAELIPMPVIDTPFKRMAMDIVGPIEKSKAGYRYILVMCDYATRYPEAVPLKSIDAEHIAEELVKIFSRVGVPEEILTDQGSNFMSKLLSEVYTMLRVRPIRSSPYHPQTDGLVERFNGTLKSMLKKFVKDDPGNWDKLLPYLLFAYREVPQESTGFSPFELLYGRKVRGPLDLMKETWEGNAKSPENVISYVLNMRDRLHEMTEIVETNMRRSQKRVKTWYDKKARKREFQRGDKVLILLPSTRNKLQSEWRGPYFVKRRVGEVDYEVELSSRKCKIYHINMLRKWLEQSTAFMITEECQEGDGIPSVCVNPQAVTLNTLTINDKLTCGQKSDLVQLLSEFMDVISDKPGRTSLIQHEIDTDNARAVRQRPYRLPEFKKEIVRRELSDMLDMGLIRRSRSEWSSPIVLVPKSDGNVRFCVDYRKLNAVSKFDAYPMPRIEDIIDRLGKAKYITKLDLCKGFWQIPLSENSISKTAFTTPFGLYEFTVMPFGLNGSGATFQRMIDMVLEGAEKSSASYIDDLVVYSETWDEHLKQLEDVLRRLRDAGLTVNPSKCEFATEEVVYLGFVVGSGSVRPAEAKVKAVLDFPIPRTKKQMKGYLGLAGYYRKFINNFSDMASPLTDVTKKRHPEVIRWNELLDSAFNKVKSALTSNPVLKNPDFSKSFILQCDASARGIGAVLSQHSDDGQEHPVAYISRKLLPRECNYATIEKECLALKWSIETFHVYLYGRQFVVKSDHNPLKWLNAMRDTNARLVRWSLALQPYSFTVEYVPGRLNVNADTLSRKDCSE